MKYKRSPWLLLLISFGLYGCVFGLVQSPSPSASPSDPSAEVRPSATPTSPLPGVVLPAPVLPLLTPEQGNLIINAGAEQLDTNGQPLDWTTDFWGKLNAEFRVESHEPFSGKHYLSTQVAKYEDGDAKWQFTAQSLAGNRWYEYSEYYRADGRNRILLSCLHPDGKRTFQNVWQSHTSNVWQKVSFRFYAFPEYVCQSNIVHVVDRNGWLHSDHHQLNEVAAQPLARPMVSIVFDDIWATAANEGAQTLQQRGMKGSFYVVSRFTLNPTDKYANQAQVDALLKAGHEVGSHSFSHQPMSTLAQAPMIHELRSNNAWLKTLGSEGTGMAYPFGDFSEKVEQEVYRFHQYARTSLTGLNDRSTNRYRLRILPVTAETTTLELKMWVDAAERTSTWLILLFHDIKNGPGDFNYTTSLQQYQEIVAYIHSKKLTVLPVHQALKEL